MELFWNKFVLRITDEQLHNVVRLLRKEGDVAYLEIENGQDILITTASFIGVAMLVGNTQLIRRVK